MAATVITMLGPMARWESGSRERLAASALRLFASKGYEGTTVAEIAAEAGLTERTFFRHYAKPEVLFAQNRRVPRARVSSCVQPNEAVGPCFHSRRSIAGKRGRSLGLRGIRDARLALDVRVKVTAERAGRSAAASCPA